MAGVRRSVGAQTARAPVEQPVLTPPQKSRWQLTLASVLFGLWMLALAWMALNP